MLLSHCVGAPSVTLVWGKSCTIMAPLAIKLQDIVCLKCANGAKTHTKMNTGFYVQDISKKFKVSMKVMNFKAYLNGSWFAHE